MADPEGSRSTTSPASASMFRGAGPLLLGSGARLDEVARVLTALESGRESPVRIGDLVELLGPDAAGGCVVLDAEAVPQEDIGLVRRFLERDGAELVVLGTDARSPTARRLLRLPGAAYLTWPPDLDQLRVLGAGREAASQAVEAPPEDAPGDPVETLLSPLCPVDVGPLLEEHLAGAAVRAPGAPRILFRTRGSLAAMCDPEVLREAISVCVELIAACAGSGDVVRVRAEGERGGAHVAVRFDLPAGPPGGRPQRASAGGLPGDLGARLARAADALEAEGGSLDLDTSRPERLAAALMLPAVDPATAG